MFKKYIFLFLLISISSILTPVTIFAQQGLRPGDICTPQTGYECCNSSDPNVACVIDGSFQCQHDTKKRINPNGPIVLTCQPSAVGKVFGKIQVPGVIGGLIKNNPTGTGAINQFLTNFIALLFSIAGIVLVFMFIWAAFEWITSGGDKEKIASAQKRILHAIIGILLFAVAFVIIRVLGIFTGFTFFKENIKVFRNAQGQIERVICSDGTPKGGPGGYIADPAKECQGH